MAKKHPFSGNLQFVGLYYDQLRNPQLWADMANEMIEALKVLEPKLREFWNIAKDNSLKEKYGQDQEGHHNLPPNLHGPYFVLVSYAVENMLKALIVKNRSEVINSQFSQKGRLPDVIRGHNLIDLSKRADIKLNIAEEDLLIRIYRQSKWKSRYPVPVDLIEIQNVARCSDGKARFMDYYRPEDIDDINNMLTKLRNHFYNRLAG
jgi:hypothetical protein